VNLNLNFVIALVEIGRDGYPPAAIQQGVAHFLQPGSDGVDIVAKAEKGVGSEIGLKKFVKPAKRAGLRHGL
jgi:hypothetical protein